MTFTFVWQKWNFPDSVQVPLLFTATLCVGQTDRQHTVASSFP